MFVILRTSRAHLQGQLLLAALNITTHLLKEGEGVFVAKIFRAEAYQLLWSVSSATNAQRSTGKEVHVPRDCNEHRMRIRRSNCDSN
jgi:hypothetical protein